MHTNKDVVSPDVQVIGPDATFAEAAQYKVRRLPIVDREKRLVGIVALGDIAVKEPEPAPAAKRCRRSRNRPERRVLCPGMCGVPVSEVALDCAGYRMPSRLQPKSQQM